MDRTELYILAGIILLFMVFFWIIIIYLERRQKNHLVEKLSHMGTIKKSESKAYDYDFNVNQTFFLVKFLFVGNIRELSFNSNKHWQIKSKKNSMIDTKGFDALEGNKMIIVYPAPKQILKYINENEVVFVRPNEKCFDYYVYTDRTIKEIKQLEV